MSLAPKEKGKKLEFAVETIEKILLENSINIPSGKFTTSRNKIIKRNGAPYEIDVFVTINNKLGYDSTYIFECKNWSTKTVERKDITEFCEKINICNAQRGFFVAKKYSKGAIKRAETEGNVVLIEFKETKRGNVHLFPEFIFDKQTIRIDSFRMTTKNNQEEIDLVAYKNDSNYVIKFQNKQVSYGEFLHSIIEYFIMKNIETQFGIKDDIYDVQNIPIVLDVTIDKGIVKINDRVINSFSLKGKINIYLGRPSQVASYYFGERGQFEEILYKFGNGQTKSNIITTTISS